MTTEKIMKNTKRSLWCILLIASVTGLFSYALYNLLIWGTVYSFAESADGQIASLLAYMLFAAALVYVFALLAITAGGVVAWLSLRLLKVPYADKIVLFATILLYVAWYVFLHQGLAGGMPLWILSVSSFIATYMGSALFVMKMTPQYAGKAMKKSKK
jgi:hypothetical protein